MRQSVQRLGGNVRSIGPHNSSGDWIEEYLSEERRGSQRFEDGPFQQGEKVDPLARAILEPQVENVRPGYLNSDDSPLHLGDLSIQRRDPPEGAACTRQVPVLFQLLSVYLAPRPDESKRPPRQATLEKSETADREHRLLSGIHGVKMGHAVVAEVHVDRDPVELRDSRHSRLPVV